MRCHLTRRLPACEPLLLSGIWRARQIARIMHISQPKCSARVTHRPFTGTSFLISLPSVVSGNGISEWPHSILHIEIGGFGYLMCRIKIATFSTRNLVELSQNRLQLQICWTMSLKSAKRGGIARSSKRGSVCSSTEPDASGTDLPTEALAISSGRGHRLRYTPQCSTSALTLLP